MMNKIAIVTGASSGIGLEISRMFSDMGITVYGIGRSFEGDESFHMIKCDLLEKGAPEKIIKDILDKTGGKLDILINNAGAGYYGLHEELSPAKISEMVRINLEVPMVLTNLLLRKLKESKGDIINISSVTALESSPHGCAYGATKAGLLSFSRSLFDEARKYGVRVTTILPDMTKTNLYRNADFREDEDTCAYLEPSEIADTAAMIISSRTGLCISEITIKPQLHRIRRKKS